VPDWNVHAIRRGPGSSSAARAADAKVAVHASAAPRHAARRVHDVVAAKIILSSRSPAVAGD
jgi:hypothetical protein